MAGHRLHFGQACRSWCAGLAAVVVVAASLASAGSVSAAAPAAAVSSAGCSGSVTAGRLVPFETIAYSGTEAGVQVGPMFCPVPGGQAVQVVVLNRVSLELVANHGYSASQFAELGSYLNSLPKDNNNEYLVIVTHPGNQPALPPDTVPQLNTSLGPIGGNLAALWWFSSPSCWSGGISYCFSSPSPSWFQGSKFYGGSFTVIGIPGMPTGQAWRETAAQNQTADGRITGYLTRGTVSTGGSGKYTVVNGPGPYVPVNTCAGDGCAVQAGDQTYPAKPDVTNGFHVVVLDRTTLTKITDQTVTTTDALLSAIQDPLVNPTVGHAVVAGYPAVIPPAPLLTDQRLVIIQSVGTGHLTGSAGAAQSLVRDIDQLGGTPEYFTPSLTATPASHYRYALVGAATDLPWHATTSLESSTAMTHPGKIPGKNGQPTGRIDGLVQRDRDGLYTPSAGDTVGETNVDLYSIVYQPAQPWPDAEDTTNLKYVADNIGLPGYPTVRPAYTNALLKGSWPNYSRKLEGLTCPPTPPQSGACDASSFEAVKTELLAEFGWVTKAYDLVGELRSPYSQATPLGFNVQTIANAVKDSLPVPNDATVTARWQQIFGAVMTTAEFVASVAGQGKAAAVFGLVGAAVTMADQTMQTPSGGPADDVTAAAGNLGARLGNQQTATYQWLNNLQDILLSDYGKLSAVGTAIQEQENGWEWTGQTTNFLIDAVNGNARAAAYSALVPVAWPAYNLTARTPPGNTNPNNVRDFYCSEWTYIQGSTGIHYYVITNQTFERALPQNQFHATTYNPNTGNSALIHQVWTFATVRGFADKSKPEASLPTIATDLTGNIYGSNATNPSVGAYQYQASWWRSTYKSPSHVACVHLSLPDSRLSRPYSTASNPPVINQPLP
jgi:hypothetical protein